MAGGARLFPDTNWAQSGSGYTCAAEPETPTSRPEGMRSAHSAAHMPVFGKSFPPETQAPEVSWLSKNKYYYRSIMTKWVQDSARRNSNTKFLSSQPLQLQFNAFDIWHNMWQLPHNTWNIWSVPPYIEPHSTIVQKCHLFIRSHPRQSYTEHLMGSQYVFGDRRRMLWNVLSLQFSVYHGRRDFVQGEIDQMRICNNFWSSE